MNYTIDTRFLRPQKAEALKEFYERPFIRREKISASCYQEAVILPQRKGRFMHGLGGVITAEGIYVEDSGIPNQFGGKYEYSVSERKEETVCFCGYLIKHWGHFLIDAVSRLWYSLEHDAEIDEYVFVVEEGSRRKPEGNYAEFFRLLGILNKVRIIDTPTCFQKVLVPERSMAKNQYYSPLYLQLFDKISEKAMKEYPISDITDNKVYLSRNHFIGARVECGLDFVDHFFEKNGFTIIYPEEISLGEMIYMIRTATVCAAESGTLPHNFLFAQNQKDVIIIERQVTINQYQTEVDIIKELNVTYVDANYEIYTTYASYGPYLLGYTDCFKKFTEVFHYKEPDSYYISERYLKKCLKAYIKAVALEYGYKRQYEPWQMIWHKAIMEAYEESLEKFGPWLDRRKPLFWRQYFQLRYIKALVKRVLRRR